MTLIWTKDKALRKLIGRSMVRINSDLWIGHLTVRELDRIKGHINPSAVEKTSIFNINDKKYDFYIKNMVDITNLL